MQVIGLPSKPPNFTSSLAHSPRSIKVKTQIRLLSKSFVIFKMLTQLCQVVGSIKNDEMG